MMKEHVILNTRQKVKKEKTIGIKDFRKNLKTLQICSLSILVICRQFVKSVLPVDTVKKLADIFTTKQKNGLSILAVLASRIPLKSSSYHTKKLKRRTLSC